MFALVSLRAAARYSAATPAALDQPSMGSERRCSVTARGGWGRDKRSWRAVALQQSSAARWAVAAYGACAVSAATAALQASRRQSGSVSVQRDCRHPAL